MQTSRKKVSGLKAKMGRGGGKEEGAGKDTFVQLKTLFYEKTGKRGKMQASRKKVRGLKAKMESGGGVASCSSGETNMCQIVYAVWIAAD